jgi:hypothetical protein
MDPYPQGRSTMSNSKRGALIVLTLLIAVGGFVGATTLVASATASSKVWVCKYVGTPGVDERLQTGQNPISVSVNALEGKGFAGTFPFEFSDAQGRSVAIGYDLGGPEPSCGGEEPPPTTTEPPVTTTSPPPPPPPTGTTPTTTEPPPTTTSPQGDTTPTATTPATTPTPTAPTATTPEPTTTVSPPGDITAGPPAPKTSSKPPVTVKPPATAPRPPANSPQPQTPCPPGTRRFEGVCHPVVQGNG